MLIIIGSLLKPHLAPMAESSNRIRDAPMEVEGGSSEAGVGSGELPRTKSRWNEWLETAAGGKFDFQPGDRIFEFSDNLTPWGWRWKPYDKDGQVELQRIFSLMYSDFETPQVPLDCLGWTYRVKFDLFHNTRQDFHRAPLDAIGFQLSNHPVSNMSKRWIRLATKLSWA